MVGWPECRLTVERTASHATHASSHRTFRISERFGIGCITNPLMGSYFVIDAVGQLIMSRFFGQIHF